ncbi:hypothetical protein G9A89_001144 [Geosiphon pyriformis]|nr:hypothetical protein G9A89_001144 [Geosiphon pyriformis]
MTTEYGGGVNGIFMVNGAVSPAEDTQAERYYIFIKNFTKARHLFSVAFDNHVPIKRGRGVQLYHSTKMGGCCASRFFENKIGRFHIVDGRRYHTLKNSKYPGTADEIEAERLRQHDIVVKHLWKESFHSPVKNNLKAGCKVLDVGCGPGTWLIEMARQYPESNFTGVDISPFFETENVPENVKFFESNLLDGLPFQDSTFDFVHQRFLTAAFTQVQWETQAVQELSRVTKPGGWIEFFECDALYEVKGVATTKIFTAWLELLKLRHINPQIGKDLPRILESTNNFSVIQQTQLKVPLGFSGGEWGKMSLEFIIRGIQSLRALLSEHMGISLDDVCELLDQMLKEAEINDPNWLQYKFCCCKNP